MPGILTLEEVAGFLKVHRSTVYGLLRKREIPAFKVGSDWRFVSFEIDLWTKLRSEVED